MVPVAGVSCVNAGFTLQGTVLVFKMFVMLDEIELMKNKIK